MKKGKNGKKIRDTKYFKWGLTAFLVIAASLLLIYLIYNASSVSRGISNFFKISMPVIDGLVIAYLINPIVRAFEYDVLEKSYIKHNLKVTAKTRKRFRAISVIVSLLLVGALLYAFFGTVLPQIYSSIQSIIIHFPSYYNNVLNSLNKMLNSTDFFVEKDIIELVNNYSEDINSFFSENVIPNISDLVVSLKDRVVGLVGAVFNLIIGVIVAIYLLLSKERYIGMLKKIIYSLFDRETANDMMTDLRFVNKTFGGFLVGKIIDSIIIGILCFIGLSVLHIPYAVLVSVIVGTTNIVPFFGPYLGAIPSAFLILLVDPRKCLYFIIFVIILQQIDGNIIGPTILGNSIGISSFWIIVAITIFGGYFGLVGMLVGVPVFACIYAFVRRQVNNRLRRRGLSTSTYGFASADYVDIDNSFVMIDRDKKSSQAPSQNKVNAQSKRYVALTLSEPTVDGGEKPSIVDNIKKWFLEKFEYIKNLFKKS